MGRAWTMKTMMGSMSFLLTVKINYLNLIKIQIQMIGLRIKTHSTNNSSNKIEKIQIKLFSRNKTQSLKENKEKAGRETIQDSS